MASARGGLSLDQNFNANYKGGSSGETSKVIKVQKKGGVGGRKPLGDLSNAGKPSLNQVSKKQNLKGSALINEDIGFPSDLTKKRCTFKASEKPQTRSRRALSDISNSANPHVSEVSKKTVKMKVLAEEPIDTGFIAEEQFLHNHRECIKQHMIGTDMDHFLETLRLSSRNKLVSPLCPSPLSSRLKHESPLRLLQYEQMAELQISAVRSHANYELSSELDSPQLPSSLKSPSIRMHWKDQDMVLLATGGANLVYLEIGDGILREIKHVPLEYQISCLDINPIGENLHYSQLAAVGMWTDVSIRIFSLPDLIPL